MDDISPDGKDNDLFAIDRKDNTWYDVLHGTPFNTQGLTAPVVQPCDSLDTCLHPLGRPLGQNETANVVCVTAWWEITLTLPHPSDLSLPF